MCHVVSGASTAGMRADLQKLPFVAAMVELDDTEIHPFIPVLYSKAAGTF
jgi:hypothetical protein